MRLVGPRHAAASYMQVAAELKLRMRDAIILEYLNGTYFRRRLCHEASSPSAAWFFGVSLREGKGLDSELCRGIKVKIRLIHDLMILSIFQRCLEHCMMHHATDPNHLEALA